VNSNTSAGSPQLSIKSHSPLRHLVTFHHRKCTKSPFESLSNLHNGPQRQHARHKEYRHEAGNGHQEFSPSNGLSISASSQGPAWHAGSRFRSQAEGYLRARLLLAFSRVQSIAFTEDEPFLLGSKAHSESRTRQKDRSRTCLQRMENAHHFGMSSWQPTPTEETAKGIPRLTGNRFQYSQA